ncbi:MAG: hypothetical protein SOX11_07670 [Lachnospiraceae bacterium]|nr:hypothetical protein [Lachnospiraceae bacterium]MDY3223005.1 hypothetical protein [Lachnospiraceae bacterium]
MDYREYLQKQLGGIRDIEERKEARELLLEGFLALYTLTEGKYQVLEERIEKELTLPGKAFAIYTTIVKKEDRDPINGFWYPLCSADLKPGLDEGRKTIYLAGNDESMKAFLQQKQILGTEEKTGRRVNFRLEKASRYEDCIKKLYGLFQENQVPWQTVPMGHLERFVDLVPEEGVLPEETFRISYGVWEGAVREDMVPLWNVEEIQVESKEFRHPCMDEVIYEHIYALGTGRQEDVGILVETEEEFLSVRYEENRVLVKTQKEELGEVKLYLLHQQEVRSSYGYTAPVLSNQRQDSLAARYLQRAGRFIQTPAELRRKVRELSKDFGVELLNYTIFDEVREKALRADMNDCLGNSLFPQDKRNILLFTFGWKKEGGLPEYLQESWLRYLLSQLQLEYLEYQCRGEWEKNF